MYCEAARETEFYILSDRHWRENRVTWREREQLHEGEDLAEAREVSSNQYKRVFTVRIR